MLTSKEKFREGVRDFLIDLCEFRQDDDSKEMWAEELRNQRDEERRIDASRAPGLVNPMTLPAGEEVFDNPQDDFDDFEL